MIMFPIRNYELKPELRVREVSDSGVVPYSYAPDVIDGSQDFCRNIYGHVKNDIALINEQTSLEVASALAEKLLQPRPSDGCIDEKVSNADLLLSLKSRYAQDPSEIVQHIERQLDLQFEREKSSFEDAEIQKEHEDRLKRLEEIRDSLSSQEKDKYLEKKREREIEELINS